MAGAAAPAGGLSRSTYSKWSASETERMSKFSMAGVIRAHVACGGRADNILAALSALLGRRVEVDVIFRGLASVLDDLSDEQLLLAWSRVGVSSR